MRGSRLTIAGHVLRHAMGVLLLCWLRALKWGAIAGLTGFAATEIAAFTLTHAFPPDGLTQVVAFALGAALAFGVAVTIIADELVVGVIDTVRLLTGEAEAGVRAAAIAARRDVGESSGRVLSLIGLGGVAAAGVARQTTPQDVLPAPPRVALGPQDEVGPRLEALRARVPSSSVARTAQPQTSAIENPWAATLTPVSEWPSGKVAAVHPAPAQEDTAPATPSAASTNVGMIGRAATDEALTHAGGPNSVTRPLAQPVHATNLPRIDWATEEPPEASPEPISEVRGDRYDAFGAASPTTQPMSDAPSLAEPSAWHIHETMPAMPERWHDPSAAAEPEPEEAGITPVDLFGAPSRAEANPAPPADVVAPERNARTPQPANIAADEPDASTPEPADVGTHEPEALSSPLPQEPQPVSAEDVIERPRGSVWDHISQVLAGRPVPQIPNEDEPLLDAPAEGELSDPGAGV
jgi:hypothetical protein